MAALRDLGKEYPFGDTLEQELTSKDWYDHPEECRYALWSYEEHLAKSLGAGSTVDEQEKGRVWRLRAADSIEHIFPQNRLAAGWRDQAPHGHIGRIGNLLLLPVLVNKQAQDRAFSDKRKSYAKHNLRMIREVCETPDWTLEQIETRENKILTWAKTRWSDL